MIWDVTYVGLFSRIKDSMSDLGQGLPRQTPQCEGYHRERHVFATPALPHRGHAIAPISEVPDYPGHYLLPVGELAGVRPESEFEIYDYRKGEPRLKGRFQNLKLGPDAYAVLCILPSPLPIELSQDLHQIWTSQEFHTDLAERLNSRYSIDRFIVPVQPGYTPKLRISRSTPTGGTKVESTDGRSRPIILRSPRPGRLSDTLAKAVMFYYHLDCQVISSQAHNPFIFQAYELTESTPNDPDYLSVLMPDPGRRSIRFHPNEETNIDGSDAQFGLCIANQSREAYYVYMFYFDPNDFSITPIYLPPTDEPSIPQEGLLTIGYGNTGASPVKFTIDRHLKTDSGFFKIFYSIGPSEMGTIQQDGVDTNQLADPRPGMPYYSQSAPPFGSVLYPVTVLNQRLSGRH